MSNRKIAYSGQSAVGRKSVTLGDLVTFSIPLLQFVEIPLGGRLLGPEIGLLVLLPFLVLMRGQLLLRRLPRTYLFLATLWLVSQVFTDLLRATPIEDLARGWAKIAFALIAFSALYLLLNRHRRRILLFAAGFAAGGILTYFLNPHPYAGDHWWKFGLGLPLSLILVLLSIAFNVRGLRVFGLALLISGALVNFYLDFRSLGAILGLTASYQLLQSLVARPRNLVVNMGSRHLLALGVIIVAVSLMILKGYAYAAQEGFLGETAQQRYELQSQGDYGLLLGGRSEILVSSRAVLDSPLLGHGSWAKDCYYASLLTKLKSQLGYIVSPEDDPCLIPAHSHILGAWVEAGVMGAVFWLWVFTLPVWVLLYLYRTNERLVPIVAFFAFLLLWDLIFSPYGSEARYRTPYEVVLMMAFLPATLQYRWKVPRRYRRISRPRTED